MGMKDDKVPKRALKGYRKEKTSWKTQRKFIVIKVTVKHNLSYLP
jgi:hypothetical protein